MKLKFFFLLSLFVIVACGAKKSESDGAGTSQRNSNTDSSCKVEIKKTDTPAIIARKAYKMQLDCKIKTEEDLTKKLLKV